MNNKVEEIYHVQNPALGATILWQFICGYKSVNFEPVPFPLLFIVLPLIYTEDLCVVISKTQRRTGLSKVSEKLFRDKMNDELYAINNFAIALREVTLKSFNMGLSTGLFHIEISPAMVYPSSECLKNSFNHEINILLDSAEKLGEWCAALTLREISELLKVRF